MIGVDATDAVGARPCRSGLEELPGVVELQTLAADGAGSAAGSGLTSGLSM
jgi:hypothetical protein